MQCHKTSQAGHTLSVLWFLAFFFFQFFRQIQEYYHNRFLLHLSQFIIQNYSPLYYSHSSRSAYDYAITLYWGVNVQMHA